MIKRVLIILSFFFSITLSAQTIFDEYQDGKIWFKVKNDYNQVLSPKENPHDLPFYTLPFIESFVTKYKIKKLSRPFFAAKDSPTLTNTFLLEFDDHQNVMQIISDLETSGKVDYAERVPYDKICLTPNDPYYSSQWHLTKIGAATAWNYFSTGSTAVVAIVDDAIERTHSDLSARVWVNNGDNNTNGIDDDNNGYTDDRQGFDVADWDNNPNPPSSSYDHGTHVAGISGATANNSAGIASIGYSVKLMCVKATNSATSITNGYDGVVYAAVNGANVINMSWGSTGSSTTGQNVMTWAYNKGCILVGGAGNSGVSTMFYPAAYTNVLAVASTTSSDAISSFSNYGSWIDISAPGSNIYSTTVGNTYGNKSGTSMASPLIAGLCGLMKSLNPSITQTALINCLKNNATNINSANPSYVGLMGAGRVDAAAAMQCVAATFTLAPVADFTSNVTIVTAGGSVSFTDQSTFNPTSWAWRFAGGSPLTYNGKTPPPIIYNTPGLYTVTLVATNANGSDSEIKVGYIDVNAGGGCQYINYPIPSAWSLAYYSAVTLSNGYANGVNSSGDKQKAMYFDASSTPYTYLTAVHTAFGKANSSNLNKAVTLRVYDGTSGSPGTQLASIPTTIGKIRTDVLGNKYTSLTFPNPVLLPTSKRFFVSFDISALAWSGSPKDTLTLISNSDGQTTPSAVWEQQSNNAWVRYNTGTAWPLDISFVMHPVITDAPAIATFTQSATNFCQGTSVNFDATGSTYDDTLLWVFPGGNPSISNSIKPTVIYNTPGTYSAKLYVVGGGCSQLDSLVSSVTVRANPVINVTSTNSNICLSGSSTLSASGASTYNWSPPTGLSGTSGSSVVASPSVTTFYNVVGTSSNGCSNNGSININVEGPPTVTVATVTTSICSGDTVVFDASSSVGVSTFAWTTPGATPSSSSSPLVAARYPSAGSYLAKLKASNSCFTDSAYYRTIVVGACASSIDDMANEKDLQLIFDPSSKVLKIMAISSNEAVVSIINGVGAIVAKYQTVPSAGVTAVEHNFATLPAGVYFVEWLESGIPSKQKVVIY